MCKENYMRQAIKLATDNVDNGGGPFGAIIVKGGQIIATGVNQVTCLNDPTAHAEVNAIRSASKYLNSFDLSDCEIYTSCEPCPMCLGAIYWARLSKIYFGNTKRDAAAIGFDDQFIYDELERPYDLRKIPTTQLMSKEAIVTFNKWDETDEKKRY